MSNPISATNSMCAARLLIPNSMNDARVPARGSGVIRKVPGLVKTNFLIPCKKIMAAGYMLWNCWTVTSDSLSPSRFVASIFIACSLRTFE